ncbi:hypothetical protein ABK01_03990 [Treponema sp. OMZ 305]|nr:hypothetical protein ABK01_03990 [Treponema sp. OMZ 305]
MQTVKPFAITHVVITQSRCAIYFQKSDCYYQAIKIGGKIGLEKTYSMY